MQHPQVVEEFLLRYKGPGGRLRGGCRCAWQSPTRCGRAIGVASYGTSSPPVEESGQAGDQVRTTSSDNSPRTRRSISSMIGRTSSAGRPAGSGSSQSTYRLPGYTGQASPQPIVTMTSTTAAASAARGVGNC